MAEYVDVISMGLNDPNLTPHDGKSFPTVEPGTYDFEIDKAVFDQSKKGNKTLKLTVKVITDGDMKGRTMVGSYVINDEEFSRRRMLSLVLASGVERDENGGFTKEALQGCVFTADVVRDEYEDIDAKTGMPAKKQFTKWVGERPCETAAPVQTATRAPANTGNAPRRPAAPNGNAASNGTNGRATQARS